MQIWRIIVKDQHKGAALGMFAQSGQVKFGDGIHAIQLMDEIRSNST